MSALTIYQTPPATIADVTKPGLSVCIPSATRGMPRGQGPMPVRKVKGGWRWGKTGKVYLTKRQAAKQGRAIKAAQAKRAKKAVTGAR